MVRLLSSIICAMAQENLPMIKDPPRPDVTQRRVIEFSEGIKNAKRLSSLIKDFGDINIKMSGETPEEYVRRFELATKAKAYLLIELRQEYEKLLLGKYELEQLEKEYKNWVDSRINEKGIQLKQDQEKLKALDEEVDLMATGVILVGQRISEYLKTIKEKKIIVENSESMKEEVDKFANVDLKKFKYKDLVFGPQGAQEKYKKILMPGVAINPEKVEKMWVEFNDLNDERRDKKLEIDLLNKKIVALGKLDPNHDIDTAREKAILAGKKLLADSRRLETEAHSVALLSRYVRQTLISLNTPGRDVANRMREIQLKLETEGDHLSECLRVLTSSGNNPVKNPSNTDDLLDEINKK